MKKANTDIVKAMDGLNEARNLVEVAFMAVDALSAEHRAPMATILDLASNKLRSCIDAIDAWRDELPDAAPAVPSKRQRTRGITSPRGAFQSF